MRLKPAGEEDLIASAQRHCHLRQFAILCAVIKFDQSVGWFVIYSDFTAVGDGVVPFPELNHPVHLPILEFDADGVVIHQDERR